MLRKLYIKVIYLKFNGAFCSFSGRFDMNPRLANATAGKKFRAAYRQFTWWVHGILGKKNRRILLACVVQVIRKEFPVESGEYMGFRAAELEL